MIKRLLKKLFGKPGPPPGMGPVAYFPPLHPNCRSGLYIPLIHLDITPPRKKLVLRTMFTGMQDFDELTGGIVEPGMHLV